LEVPSADPEFINRGGNGVRIVRARWALVCTRTPGIRQ
jgi:hypothetical protein